MMWASFGFAPAGEHPLERGDVDPVGLELDHPHVGAAVAQRQQRAVVGGPLDDHRVAGLDQRVEQERVGLHRAVGDDHLLGRDLVALGDPLAQRRVADRGPVAGHAPRIGRRRRGRRRRAGRRRRRCRARGRRGRTRSTWPPHLRLRVPEANLDHRAVGPLVRLHCHLAHAGQSSTACSNSRRASRLPNGPATRVTRGHRGRRAGAGPPPEAPEGRRRVRIRPAARASRPGVGSRAR